MGAKEKLISSLLHDFRHPSSLPRAATGRRLLRPLPVYLRSSQPQAAASTSPVAASQLISSSPSMSRPSLFPSPRRQPSHMPVPPPRDDSVLTAVGLSSNVAYSLPLAIRSARLAVSLDGPGLHPVVETIPLRGSSCGCRQVWEAMSARSSNHRLLPITTRKWLHPSVSSDQLNVGRYSGISDYAGIFFRLSSRVRSSLSVIGAQIWRIAWRIALHSSFGRLPVLVVGWDGQILDRLIQRSLDLLLISSKHAEAA